MTMASLEGKAQDLMDYGEPSMLAIAFTDSISPLFRTLNESNYT